MRFVLSVFILFLAAVFEISSAPHLNILGISPDFILVLILFWSFLKPAKESLILAFLGGLFVDFFSLSPFGMNIFIFLLISYFFNFTVQNILRVRNFKIFVILIFCGTIIYRILVVLTIRFTNFFYLPGKIFEFNYDLFYSLFPEAVYNIFLVFFIFVFLQYFRKYLSAF